MVPAFGGGLAIRRNTGDDNAFWETDTVATKVTNTRSPTTFLTAEIPGVTIDFPDSSGDLCPAPVAAEQHSGTLPKQRTDDGTLSALYESAVSDGELRAAAGRLVEQRERRPPRRRCSPRRFRRSHYTSDSASAQVFDPHSASEYENERAIGVLSQFLATHTVVKEGDPRGPLWSVHLEVVWNTDFLVADWDDGQNDDFVTSFLPTDTRFYVTWRSPRRDDRLGRSRSCCRA